MSDDSTTNVQQSTYQNYQNLQVNVQKMYKHYITGSSTPGDNEIGEIPGIDDVRATITLDTTRSKTVDLVNSLNISPTSKVSTNTANTTTPVQFAQESRCHAFYRIIGFPVIASDAKSYYNPGLDVIRQYDVNGNPIPRKIGLKEKIEIASKIDSKFEAISRARETYAAGTAQIFAVPASVEAGVLALTSGTYGDKGSPNIRPFNAPFATNTSLNPFDFELAHQTYQKPGNISSTSSRTGELPLKLSEYQDNSGNTPNAKIGGYQIMSGHSHIIVPFMVDPRIDFSIWANGSSTVKNISRRIAVPFAPDASFLMAGSSNFSDRPYLEKIITKRYSAFNNTTDAGQATEDLVDYVKSFKNIQDVKIGSVAISDIFSNQIYKLSQQASFAKYLNKMQSLVDALVAAMNTIHARQGNFYWLPSPSQSGPEGGCDIRAVPINIKFRPEFLTINDRDIIKNQLDYFMTNINSGASQANAIPDIAGVSSPGPGITFDTDTSDAEGDVTANAQENLTTRRTRLLKDAGEALQIVEMIMGEFSGLGLCDIVAILGALNVMPKEFLLGFLDADAYSRARTVVGGLPQDQSQLQASDGKSTAVNITNSMTALASYVSSFYQIMDKMFQEAFGQNAIA